MIYIIEKAWYDSLTSMREPDQGYDPVGYVDTEEEAKAIVESGGITDRPSWNPIPMFRYKPIKKYNKSPDADARK